MATDAKHGAWTFRLSAGVDPKTKRRRQIRGGAYATKREAQQERNKALVKLDAGKLATPSRETFGEYLQKWLERRSRMGSRGGKPLAPNTLENYRRYAEQDIVPSTLGSIKLRDMRRGHVQAFIDDLVEAGRGAVTVRRIIAVVQGALSSAVREELIEYSPARHLELPHVDADPFEPWKPEQVGHFLDVAGTCAKADAAARDRCVHHRLGPLFETAVWTGLRRAELVALRWGDVDLAGRELRVRKSKTEAGVRRVPLGDAARDSLIRWKDAQKAERAAWGDAWTDTGHVFTMADGRPLKLQYATRLFESLRVEADLPAMTLHGLRHTCASLYLASGADIEFVSKLLGHGDGRVTSAIYSHMVVSKGRDRADQAAAMVPRKTSVPTLHPHEEVTAQEPAPASAETGS